MLVDLRERADRVIDTTYLTVKDLRDTLHSLYGAGPSGMLVHVTSFGYRYGLPPAADLVFDVRFMDNPFYIPELRPLTGSDPPNSEKQMESEGRRRARSSKEVVRSWAEDLEPLCRVGHKATSKVEESPTSSQPANRVSMVPAREVTTMPSTKSV